MKKLLSVIFLLTTITYLGSCQNAGPGVKENLSADQFEAKLKGADVQLIDVRTPGEYEEGHLKDAVNIDINSGDFEQKLAKLDKNKPVLVYCLSGGRSGSAAGILNGMGFKEVYNLNGGIMSWNNAGKPTQQGAAPAKAPGMTIGDFNKAIGGKGIVLVDYNAPWCAPCQKMRPILEKLAERHKADMRLFLINADDNKELMKERSISGIPHLELYKDGRIVWTHDGYIDEADLLKETGL